MSDTYLQTFVKICSGIVSHLENLPGVSNVTVDEKPPTERHKLLMWEQQNSCFLPDDMKSFYLTTNGIKLTWCLKFDDDILPLGLLEINSLDKVVKVCGAKQHTDEPFLDDLNDHITIETDSQRRQSPSFDTRSRIFELDACRGCGKVCLVYQNTQSGTPAQNAEIWFMDRSLRWHFLTDSFSNYFQMMLVHIGLPEWQYAFTDVGLSPQSQTWFHMFAPMRLAIDQYDNVQTRAFLHQDDVIPDVILDNNKVFKAKTDKRAKSGIQKKKPVQNKPGSSRSGASSSSSRGR